MFKCEKLLGRRVLSSNERLKENWPEIQITETSNAFIYSWVCRATQQLEIQPQLQQITTNHNNNSKLFIKDAISNCGYFQLNWHKITAKSFQAKFLKIPIITVREKSFEECWCLNNLPKKNPIFIDQNKSISPILSWSLK